MSETIKNHEAKADGVESGLAEMPAFDPEKAQENVDRAKRELDKKAEAKKSKSDAETGSLQIMAEKPKVIPVEELSEKDAAQEYLDLLMELSGGFTSPEGKASRVVGKNDDGSEVIMNGGYSGDAEFAESMLTRATSKEEVKAIEQRDREGRANGEFKDYSGPISSNKYIDRAHSLKLADRILKAEAAWRKGGEMFDQEVYDKAKDELEEYQEKDSKKFFLVKLLTHGKRKKELARLKKNYADASEGLKMTARADKALRGALSDAYDEEYSYGSHSETLGTTEAEKSARNEKFNDQFFSEENQEKIDRAIELRNKLNRIKPIDGNTVRA